MRNTSSSCLYGLVCLTLIALFDFSTASETATFSPWLRAGFNFNWTPPKVNVSVPTTAQCDHINITWGPLNQGGPDPVPPYYLYVYTSTLTYPLIVDAGSFSPFEWVVPFPPDTQYQICMFDSKGNTGGCQDSYTVMPPTNASLTCNETLSIPTTLSVQGSTETGPLTEYGWPDQCTTISLTVQNGTPPFTMTVAPSLHPPLNLTFNNRGPMDWTITLGWGMRFWISLVDATGASWAYGPLHSGGNGPTDCLYFSGNSLIVQPSVPSSHTVSVNSTVGIAIGALACGIISTLVLQWLWGYRRRYKSASQCEIGPDMQESGIEPYPVEALRSQQQIDARSNQANTIATERPADSQVYVVHHDGGGAPITIFTAGRDVQELPPHYAGTSPEPTVTHAPSASMDSTSRSNETQRGKADPPLRSVTS